MTNQLLKTALIFILLLTASTIHSQSRRSKKQKAYPRHFIAAGFNVNLSPETLNLFDGNRSGRGLVDFVFEDDVRLNMGLTYRRLLSKNRFFDLSLTKAVVHKEDHILLSYFDNLTQTERGDKNTAAHLGVRFEYGLFSGDDKKSRFRAGLSAGVESFSQIKKWAPNTSTWFPFHYFQIGARLSVIPQLWLKLNNRTSVNIKYSPNLFYFYWERSRVDNPILTKEDQTTTSTTAGSRIKNTFLSFNLFFEL